MDVIYCKKCHIRKRGIDYNKAADEIKEILGADSVDDICVSYCGPGAKEYFAVVEDELVTADTYEELLTTLKEETW